MPRRQVKSYSELSDSDEDYDVTSIVDEKPSRLKRLRRSQVCSQGEVSRQKPESSCVEQQSPPAPPLRQVIGKAEYLAPPLGALGGSDILLEDLDNVRIPRKNERATPGGLDETASRVVAVEHERLDIVSEHGYVPEIPAGTDDVEVAKNDPPSARHFSDVACQQASPRQEARELEANTENGKDDDVQKLVDGVVEVGEESGEDNSVKEHHRMRAKNCTVASPCPEVSRKPQLRRTRRKVITTKDISSDEEDGKSDSSAVVEDDNEYDDSKDEDDSTANVETIEVTHTEASAKNAKPISARKRTKRDSVSSDELEWQPEDAGSDVDIDDVPSGDDSDSEYEEPQAKRTAKCNHRRGGIRSRETPQRRIVSGVKVGKSSDKPAAPKTTALSRKTASVPQRGDGTRQLASNALARKPDRECVTRKTLGARRISGMSQLVSRKRGYSIGAGERKPLTPLSGISGVSARRFRVGLSKHARVPRLHAYLSKSD